MINPSTSAVEELGRMKILSVDDNPTNLKLLRAVLESEGYEVVEASDGVEALAVLEREPVDVIISDILMPNMDGYKLCYEVRRSKKFRNLPFITYTSTYTSPSDERFALEVGADKYLRKPAQAKLLLEVLSEFSTDPKYRNPRLGVSTQETHVMRAYSKVLVEKLQERNAELEQAKAEISKMNEDLERRVRDRTMELELANQELEAFSHSAAHDLRAPLRAIDANGFLLKESLRDNLEPDSATYIDKIRTSVKQMNGLIDDLLKLSYVGRCDIEHRTVDVSAIAESLATEFRQAEPSRSVEVSIQSGILRRGDRALIQIALQNLMSNAWKFTQKAERPMIELGVEELEGHEVIYLRDNGVGFDMAKSERLFRPFERLHAQNEFPGTGLGLTIVKRIVARHHGQSWIRSAPGVGTTFYIDFSERVESQQT